MNVVCAVLAAGASTRLGRPKQLVCRGERETLVGHAVTCAIKCSFTRTAVVLGAHRAEIKRSLGGARVDIVTSDWQYGLSASIRAATIWANAQAADALMLCACDQPLLSASHLSHLLRESARGTRPSASFYANRAAIPALFPRSYFPALLELSGDAGASGLLRTSAEVMLVPWPAGEFDVDTESDVLRLSHATPP